MTSRERMLKVLKGEKVDRVPVTIYIDALYAEHVKKSFTPDAINDCFELQRAAGFDIFLRQIPVGWEQQPSDRWIRSADRQKLQDGEDIVFYFDTPKGRLRSVFRVNSRKPGYLPSYAYIEHIVKTPDDFQRYAEYFPGEQANSLENISYSRKLVGDAGIISTDIGGVFNSAVECRGVQELILDALDDEEFYRAQMEFQTNRIKRLIDALAADPVDIVRHYDNEANGAIIDRRFYERFILPYEHDVISYAESKGLKVMLHNCGPLGSLLEAYPATGATAVESFTPPPSGDADFDKVSRTLHDRMVLVGGIDQIHLLSGTDRAVVAGGVKDAIRRLKGDKGYIACTTDQIDANISSEQLQWYRHAAMEVAEY